MNQQEVYKYAVCYSQIKHPLYSEKKELKDKYVALMIYFAKKYCPNSNIIDIRLKTFRTAMFEEDIEIESELDYKNLAGNVLKTRFSPFRFFSYRYLFLFDCLLLFAADNSTTGQKICDELKESINSRYYNGLDMMVQQMYSGDSRYAYKRLITNEMINAWNDITSYIRSSNRNITFTATMSAGKSTLINAIIGQELSYAKKAACTATVMKFISAPAVGRKLNVFSGEEIKPQLTAREVKNLTKGLEYPCDISGYFISILSKMKITLIDTPGVNSSQNPNHKKTTRSELTGENTDIVVYIIPVENYGSEGDFNHLSYIKSKVKYRDILFVVNMIDSCDFEDDSVPEIVRNISEHLASIGFDNPKICPMSAKAGMMIKQALTGIELSQNDKRACENYVNIFLRDELTLGTYYPEIDCHEIRYSEHLKVLDYNVEKVLKAYINTGLPGFEKTIYDIAQEGR